MHKASQATRKEWLALQQDTFYKVRFYKRAAIVVSAIILAELITLLCL